jgi:hypothetical protein
MPRPAENAEILGFEALAWLAGDADILNRFLAASGTDAGTLREAVENPALLGAVLDFLLADEALLVRFCEEKAVRPQSVHAAHRALEGPCA